MWPRDNLKLHMQLTFVVLIKFMLDKTSCHQYSVWSTDQEFCHHLGVAQKCNFLDPIPGQLKQNLCFNKLPRLFSCTLKVEKHCPSVYGFSGAGYQGKTWDFVLRNIFLMKFE